MKENAKNIIPEKVAQIINTAKCQSKELANKKLHLGEIA